MQKIINIEKKKKKQIDKDDIINLLINVPSRIPTSFLYDDFGSKLFESICKTKEYYLTRTEKKILEEYRTEIIKENNSLDIFEFGSGSSEKSSILINAWTNGFENLSYTSLDISEEALNMTNNEIKKISTKIKINLFKGNFLTDLKKIDLPDVKRLFLFLGSTIGNFDDKLAYSFLSSVKNVMKKKDLFLLGADMIKDKKIINSAYNDIGGITEKFNKNILDVINKNYDFDFSKNLFAHEARLNLKKSQVEMYLISKTRQKIKLSKTIFLKLKKGDRILTEISRKFSINMIEDIINKSGLKIKKVFFDDKKFYSLFLICRI